MTELQELQEHYTIHAFDDVKLGVESVLDDLDLFISKLTLGEYTCTHTYDELIKNQLLLLQYNISKRQYILPQECKDIAICCLSLSKTMEK